MSIRSISAAPPVATPAPPPVKSSTTAAPAQGNSAVAAAALKAVSAAVQEAHESPGQTMKEASAGDPQAKKLLHQGGAAPQSRVGAQINTKA